MLQQPNNSSVSFHEERISWHGSWFLVVLVKSCLLLNEILEAVRAAQTLKQTASARDECRLL